MLVSRATRSTLNPGIERWENREDEQHERNPWTAFTNPVYSAFEKLSIEGDLRVTGAEAAAVRWCEKSPAHLTPQDIIVVDQNLWWSNQATRCSDQTMRFGELFTSSPPLRKECDQDLTEGASHWRGEEPQPRKGDGITGGDAGEALKCLTLREPLVGERQPLGPAVSLGSNPLAPEKGQPGHLTPNPVFFNFGVPFLGASSEDSSLNHPIFAESQRRETPSSDPPRGSSPKNMLLCHLPEMQKTQSESEGSSQ
jgi:hypothetical protein